MTTQCNTCSWMESWTREENETLLGQSGDYRGRKRASEHKCSEMLTLRKLDERDVEVLCTALVTFL